MRQPAKPKPQAFEEVARVLNVYRMLREELAASETPADRTTAVLSSQVLAVAERIAARTEG